MAEDVKVDIIPDSKSLFEPNKLSEGDVIYAYLDNSEDGLCLNEKILSLGLASLQEDSYLFDRRERFKKIAGILALRYRHRRPPLQLLLTIVETT
ncbi:MAG: hypothetical protein LUD00_00570 [Prevotellaceae bacterium]|nr:hypothetical protein [Prevotellaceae bacterium]